MLSCPSYCESAVAAPDTQLPWLGRNDARDAGFPSRGSAQSPCRSTCGCRQMRHLDRRLHMDQRHPRSLTRSRQHAESAVGPFGCHAKRALARSSGAHRSPTRCACHAQRTEEYRHHERDSARSSSKGARRRTDRYRLRLICERSGDCRPRRDSPGSRRAWLSSDPETLDHVHRMQRRFIRKLGDQHNDVPGRQDRHQ